MKIPPHTSQIEPHKLRKALIREELVALTGDFKKAILLNYFLYWHHHTKDAAQFIAEEASRAETIGIDLSEIPLDYGWIYKSAEEISLETMMQLSPSSIRAHIKYLIDNGWLHERQNPRYKWDKKKQYRCDIIQIQYDLKLLEYPLDGYTLSQDKAIANKYIKTNDKNKSRIIYNKESGKLEGISTQNMKDWTEVYKNIIVMDELLKLVLKLRTNTKEIEDMNSYVNWFLKTQDDNAGNARLSKRRIKKNVKNLDIHNFVKIK